MSGKGYDPHELPSCEECSSLVFSECFFNALSIFKCIIQIFFLVCTGWYSEWSALGEIFSVGRRF